MNARDIIAEAADTWFIPGEAAEAALNDLRSAANASEGDTITIGPDGTVGRLERLTDEALTRGSTKYPSGRYADCGGCDIEWDDDDPLYRVVTP